MVQNKVQKIRKYINYIFVRWLSAVSAVFCALSVLNSQANPISRGKFIHERSFGSLTGRFCNSNSDKSSSNRNNHGATYRTEEETHRSSTESAV